MSTTLHHQALAAALTTASLLKGKLTHSSGVYGYAVK